VAKKSKFFTCIDNTNEASHKRTVNEECKGQFLSKIDVVKCYGIVAFKNIQIPKYIGNDDRVNK
jgi:hypothetical protein